MALTSPGVEVTIIDQSQYLPSAVTSVPMILLATAQDKATASGVGIAAATTKANANKLYLVTSQRDLVTLYGNPFFYKTTDGTPIQGYELNEYGLLAAYSLLGITNRAYVLRADIDLAALVGQVTRPTGAPVDGTFWLDTTNSTWGIQEWNQQTGAFTYKTPIVITEASQVTLSGPSYVPVQSVGTIGDYAIVQVNDPSTHYITPALTQLNIFYKAGGNTSSPIYNSWIPIGDYFSTSWSTLWPALTTTVNGIIPGGIFYIRGYDSTGTAITATNGSDSTGIPVTVTVSNNVINDINNALAANGLDNLISVTAVPTGSGIGGGSATPSQIIWNIIGQNVDSITLSSASTTLLQALGITTTAKSVSPVNGKSVYQAWSPTVQWGTNAQTPRWRSFDATPRPTGSVFLKSNNINNGTNLVLSKYTTATAVFTQQACNLYTSDAAAIAAIDPTGGGKNITANTTYASYNQSTRYVDAQTQIFKRATTGPITYTGTQTPTGVLPGETFTIQYTTAGQSTYTTPALVTLPYRSGANANVAVSSSDIINSISAAVGTGSPVLANVNTQGQLTLTHSQGGSIKLGDTTNFGVQNIQVNQLANVTYNTLPTININNPTFNGLPAQAVFTGSLAANVINSPTVPAGNTTSLVIDFSNTLNWQPGDTFTIARTTPSLQPALGGGTAAQFTVLTVDNTGQILTWSYTPGSGYTQNGQLLITSAPTRSGIVTPTLVQVPIVMSSVAVMTVSGAGYTSGNLVVNANTFSTTSGNLNGSILGGGAVQAIAPGTLAGVTGTLPAPAATVVVNTPTGGTAATITANVNGSGVITSFTVTNGGSGYSTATPLTITSINGTAFGSLTGSIGTINITGFNATTPVNNVTLSSGMISKLGFTAGINSSARYENVASPTSYLSVVGTGVTYNGNSAAVGSSASFNIGTDFFLFTNAAFAGTISSRPAGYYTIPGTYFGGATPANDLTVFYPNTASAGAYVVEGAFPVGEQQTLLSGFTAFTYVANEGAPVTLPANNTQWYYSVVDQADIMIQDNGIWQGYRNVTMDSRGYNLTNTDPNGPILATDAPTVQSDGTPLVYGDLWIDSNDLENYPLMFRWENVNEMDQWVPINNADHTTQNGVLFADARWAGSSTVDPINDPVPSIKSMLTSNYIDPDAPTATSYPEGMLLFNTRRSGYNIKEFRTNYFTALKYPNANPLPTYSYTWVSTSGLMTNGAPYMGRKAQRSQVVKALQASIATNMSIREEDTFFNLLACPNYCELQPSMVTLNNDRNNTGYIVGDTPLRLPDQATAITAWATNAAKSASTSENGLVTRDTYLGIYYPSGITTDLSGSNVVVPPSHMMLRTILRNDQVAYPWFAPAGTRRGTIDNANNIGYIDAATGEFIVTKNRVGIRDVLYSNFINPLTFFTNVGLLNYGNKNSKDSQSSLDRTNVARLICYIRERLTVLARPFVFEPNDAQTRRDIQGVVTTLLADVLSKRGIYDYLVVCDTSNNTPARIDRNELWIDVAIEPAKAVEFIYIPVRILNTGEIAGLGQNG
jgi:hypothetical protein